MNLKVRVKNPVFWVQTGISILATILAYFGLTGAEMTSWAALGGTLLQAAANPYVLFLVATAVWNALNDPTTRGAGDSARAKTYTKPGGE